MSDRELRVKMVYGKGSIPLSKALAQIAAYRLKIISMYQRNNLPVPRNMPIRGRYGDAIRILRANIKTARNRARRFNEAPASDCPAHVRNLRTR